MKDGRVKEYLINEHSVTILVFPISCLLFEGYKVFLILLVHNPIFLFCDIAIKKLTAFYHCVFSTKIKNHGS